MKTLITIVGCLLLSVISSSVFASAVAEAMADEKASTDRQAAEQNQANRSEQLNVQDIRDTASRQRQTIENRYLAGLAELKEEALLQAQRIRLRDRMLWTEFISESCQKFYADNYIYGTPTLYYDLKALKLRRDMTDSYFLNTAADFLMDADARKLLDYIANNNAPRDSNNLSIRRRAQKLLEVMDYFAMMSERLENQRASESADVQIWEESSIADAQKTSPPTEAAPYGTVIAVAYYNKGVFCMIEGIDEMIKAGDTINNARTKNVKIVKIDIGKARVEFDRNGRQWAQKTGQSPNPGWK